MGTSEFKVGKPFAPRDVEFRGVIECAGYRLKAYSIVYGDAPLEEAVFEKGMKLAADDLPRPAIDAHRPGVGFVIFHQGDGVHYLVLNWWDRENEMPIRTWVNYFEDDAPWRPASGGESVCVWDLEVIGHERNAYVETILTPTPPEATETTNIESYLSRTFSCSVPSPA